MTWLTQWNLERLVEMMMECDKHSMPHTIQVGNEMYTAKNNETILNCLERNGMNIPHNCRNGYCGTCEIYTLIEGDVRYNKYEQKGGELTVCKAIPTANIRIEERSK